MNSGEDICEHSTWTEVSSELENLATWISPPVVGVRFQPDLLRCGVLQRGMLVLNTRREEYIPAQFAH